MKPIDPGVYKFLGILSILVAVLVMLVLAVVSKRPVKVSVSDSIFIDFGIHEARVGVEEFAHDMEGPPARYIATFQLENGKKLYVLMDGSCRLEGGSE